MSQLNWDQNTNPHALTKDLAAQNGICNVCGAKYVDGNVNFCTNCGAPLRRNPYAAGIMNEQQLDQSGHALYSYCKGNRATNLVPVSIVVTVLEGLIITLLALAGGVNLLSAVIIGGLVSGVFAFICWLAYRVQSGSAKRFNSYLAEDGGQSMFSDFASAQPFADDQFRLGRHYLFIKNSAVLRLDSITDIVRITTHYRMIPTGVYLNVKVKDENGSMAFLLCRVHMLKAHSEINEIRNAVLQRRDSVQNDHLQ